MKEWNNLDMACLVAYEKSDDKASLPVIIEIPLKTTATVFAKSINIVK